MYASVEAHADGNEGQIFLYRPSANVAAPNENPSHALSISDFPFPFEDHDDFNFTDLLFEHRPLADQEAEDHKVSDQIQDLEKNWETDQHVTENSPNHDHDHHQQQKKRGKKKKIETPRKRPSKRDRHTKIKTAQGVRDRRVRLSLEVAGSFFRLHDMLRFDKASKTIDWLLKQARHEINARLERENLENNVLLSSSSGVQLQSMASTSECEVPGLDEVMGSTTNDKQDEAKPSVKERRIKRSRKDLLKPRPKEVRAKARERARERTQEKIMRSKKLVLEESRHSAKATNYRTHIVGEDSHTTCQNNTNRSLYEVAKDQERSLQSKDHFGVSYEQSLLTVGKSNSPFLFSSLQDSETIQDHQFAVLQCLNNRWEAYSLDTLH